MLLDSGILTIYELKNYYSAGRIPKQTLVEHSKHYYGERTIGFSRQYAAMGVNQQVDLLARIWHDRSIVIGMYATDEDGNQYRIDNVQHLTDEDGLRVTDLTLSRIENLYDIGEKYYIH